MDFIDQRRELRERIIGDISWSYASDPNEYNGLLVEKSKSGMSIMTYDPIKAGSILRVDFKGSLMGTQYVTVTWCCEISQNNYRCGLSVIKHY